MLSTAYIQSIFLLNDRTMASSFGNVPNTFESYLYFENLRLDVDAINDLGRIIILSNDIFINNRLFTIS